MAQTQLPKQQDARFVLRSERLGPLPLINHFIERSDPERLAHCLGSAPGR
jgi:hypothetical protein